MKIGVMGAGTWGTALSQVLAENGHNVIIWHYRKDFAEQLEESRIHPNLPDAELRSNIKITNEDCLIADCEIILIAIPSHAIRNTLSNFQLLDSTKIICASKGIENETGKLVSQIITEIKDVSESQIICLSGPSHAEEVFKKLPTTVVSACSDLEVAREIQKIFSNDYFRVYANSDIIGVEVGGATKNVIAIASGICQGLGFGDNTMAALVTRGLTEIIRLGEALGAERNTFSGLSGIGDLIVTSYSKHSRNREVGLQLSQGKPLSIILNNMKMIAEGVKTTQSIYELSIKLGLDMPISTQVYNVLFNNKSPKQAIVELMNRDLVDEQLS